MIRNRILTVVAIAFFFLVQGCANTAKSITASDPFDPTRKGILFGSLTTSSTDGWVFIRKKGDKGEPMRLEAAGAFNSGIDLQSQGSRGRLFALDLTPGNYEIVTWRMFKMSAIGYGYIGPNVTPTPIPFQVQPNEAVYLGRFKLHEYLVEKKNLLGFTSNKLQAQALILNAYDEDISLFRKKLPNLSKLPVRQSVPKSPDPSAWVSRSEVIGD